MTNLECQTLSVAAASKILGVSRNTGYSAAKAGQLPVLRIGRKIRVPKALLERMLTTSAGVTADDDQATIERGRSVPRTAGTRMTGNAGRPE